MTPAAVYRDTIRRMARPERSDEELLDRFRQGRDEAAFAELVRRHGPMVRAVCRRSLDAWDADDAFQATFLVLVRRAASIRRGRPLANWLCGVAYLTARQALRTRRKWWRRERSDDTFPEPFAPESPSLNDWLPRLDAAVQALPERFRVPLILCDLEEVSRSEAARQLGLREGTLSSRLARARQMLRRRLGGQMSPLALLAALAPVAVSASLARAAAQSATAFHSGRPLPVGTVPTRVLDLVKGVLSAMHVSSWKIGAGVVLMLALAGAIVFGSVHYGWLPAAQADGPTPVALPNPVPDKPLDPVAAERERLQGAWRMVRHEINGDVDDVPEDVVLIFAGKRFLQVGRDGLAEGTYQVEPDRNPKRIDVLDVKVTEGRDAGKTALMSLYGIYKVEGDRLTICFGPENKRSRRPAEFVGEKDSESRLVVLERIGAATQSKPERSAAKDAPAAQRPANVEAIIAGNKLTLPFQVDTARRDDVKELVLHMSRNEGRSWTQAAVAPPDARKFELEVDEPGDYLFTLLITDKSGRTEPTSTPALRVRFEFPKTEPKEKKSEATPLKETRRAQAEAFREQARTRLSLAEKLRKDGELNLAALEYELVWEALRFWESTDDDKALERELIFWQAAPAAVECWTSKGNHKQASTWKEELVKRHPGLQSQLRRMFQFANIYRANGQKEQRHNILLQMRDIVAVLDEQWLSDNVGLKMDFSWKKVLEGEMFR